MRATIWPFVSFGPVLFQISTESFPEKNPSASTRMENSDVRNFPCRIYEEYIRTFTRNQIVCGRTISYCNMSLSVLQKEHPT